MLRSVKTEHQESGTTLHTKQWGAEWKGEGGGGGRGVLGWPKRKTTRDDFHSECVQLDNEKRVVHGALGLHVDGFNGGGEGLSLLKKKQLQH